MPTISDKLIDLVRYPIEKDDDGSYRYYEFIAKQKFYEALPKYRYWEVKNYRFTEYALYLKIQKGETIKRFGFYPIKYDSIYVPNQTFRLEADVLDSCFYSPAYELYMRYLTCCASGFYNEFGSH